MIVLKLLSYPGIVNTRNIMKAIKRCNSTFKKLYFEEHGDPLKVLKIAEEPLPSMQSDEASNIF